MLISDPDQLYGQADAVIGEPGSPPSTRTTASLVRWLPTERQPDAIAREVEELTDLNLEGLRAQWRRRFGVPPRCGPASSFA